MTDIGECLIGEGSPNNKGYLTKWHEGRAWLLHRLVWTEINGTIPDDMVICHTCDNPPCINPSHLFLGTVQDNIDDKVAKGRARGMNSGRTHCDKGHALTEDNRLYAGGRSSGCLTCHREYQRAWCAAKKEASRGA